MSLLSPSRHLLLSPGHVGIAGAGQYRESPVIEPGGAGILKALADLLHVQPMSGRADVVLSQKLAPGWLVAPPPARLNWKETGGWVQDRLANQFGEQAGKWRLSWMQTPPGEPILVSGVEATWLLELLALLKVNGIQATHVRPWLAATCQRYRRALGRGPAWLALAEPGRLTLAGMKSGRIESLRTSPFTDDPAGALAGMVEREALLGASDRPNRVWLQTIHVGSVWHPPSGVEYRELTSNRAGLGAMIGA